MAMVSLRATISMNKTYNVKSYAGTKAKTSSTVPVGSSTTLIDPVYLYLVCDTSKPSEMKFGITSQKKQKFKSR
jgi:hypothetical protein